MAMVTVYSFKAYDINEDRNPPKPRKATLKAIKSCQCAPIEDTAEEVDEARLDGNEFLRDLI